MDNKYKDKEREHFTTISFRTTKHFSDELAKYAEKACLTKAELMRRAVRYFMDNGLV